MMRRVFEDLLKTLYVTAWRESTQRAVFVEKNRLLKLEMHVHLFRFLDQGFRVETERI